MTRNLYVLTLIGGDFTNITKIRIQNDGDADKCFEYTGNITNGDVVKIDCKKGTVEKNGVDDIAHFSGSFLNLVSESNSIITCITGVMGTITSKLSE